MLKQKISGMLAAAFVVLIAAQPVYAKENRLPEGIYVGNINLEGLTEAEAEKQIEQEVKRRAESSVVLDVNGTELNTTAKELGFSWINQDAARKAAGYAVQGNLIEQYMERKDLQKTPVHIALETKVDSGVLDEYVQEHCMDLIVQPQNASITRVNDRFEITPEKVGMAIDSVATGEQMNQLLAEQSGNTIHMKAVIIEKDPDIRADMFATITDVLGTFSTDFSSSGASRAGNLKNGASKINGHVLLPGETLSGYDCMHPFTTDNGYFTAAAYENGQVVDSVGGGVCQIATTLYNAALLAELEITQRQNHSMIVGYVKPSMDAAIAGTYKDIKITNNYSTPIYVEGGTAGRTLFFTIYGKETRPTNRKIEYISETLSTTDPGAPTQREDRSLAPGTTKQVQSAHIGRKSRLWKVVTVDGVETERIMLHEDTYNPAKAIVLVGPAQVPENVETQVPQTPEQTEQGTSAQEQPAVQESAAPEPAAQGPAVSGQIEAGQGQTSSAPQPEAASEAEQIQTPETAA